MSATSSESAFRRKFGSEEGRDASRTTQNTELKLLTAGVEYRSHRGLPDCE